MTVQENFSFCKAPSAPSNRLMENLAYSKFFSLITSQMRDLETLPTLTPTMRPLIAKVFRSQLKKPLKSAKNLSQMEQLPCNIGSQPISTREQTTTFMALILLLSLESIPKSGWRPCPVQQKSPAYQATLTSVAVSITFSMMKVRTLRRVIRSCSS